MKIDAQYIDYICFESESQGKFVCNVKVKDFFEPNDYFKAIDQKPFSLYNVPGRYDRMPLSAILEGRQYSNVNKYSKTHDIDWFSSIDNGACLVKKQQSMDD